MLEKIDVLSMKRTIKFTSGLLFISAILVIFGFSGSSFPRDKIQQLIAKTNLFNLQFPQEKIYLHLDRSSYWADEDVWFKAYLLNSPIRNCNLYVELLNSSGKIVNKNLHWAQNGLAYGDFHLADTLSSGVYQIRAYTNWMRNFDDVYFFRKELVIWNPRDKGINTELKELRPKDIDLQFFPEGGTFVINQKNKVAFKAVDRLGKGVDLEGEIVDNSGNKITEIKSKFRGIGSFVIEPQKGKKYTAKLLVGDNILNFDLPEPTESGVILAINPLADSIIQIQISGNLQSKNNDGMYLLLAQSEGEIFSQKEISTVGGSVILDIEKSKLPAGIVKFTLLDENIIPLCERLVFVKKPDFVNLTIEMDKTVYKTREKVELDVAALTKTGIPCLSNLSMSVYNLHYQTETEDYANNILTQFLLNSELKGTIEDPAWYFKDDSLSTLLALDNLMLTQGYRYFEWEEILEDKYPEIEYQPEPSIEVKGNVVSSILGKPVPNCKITMMTLKSQLGVYEEKTDSLGQFTFSNLYFNDTAYFSIQAINRKGRRNNYIELDRKSYFPPESNYLPGPYQFKTVDRVKTYSYLSDLSANLVNKKWHLSDTILLGDVNVVTRQKKKDDGHFRQYASADYVVDIADKDYLLGNIIDAIDGLFPGVRYEVANNSFIYRNRPLMLYLDGIQVDYTLLSGFPVEAFDKIELVRMAIFAGINYDGGILFFFTKRGEKFINAPRDAVGMKSTRVIGYSVIRKFYSPQYETNEKPELVNDFRSTLYWNPIVRTDATGVAKVEFYNSDETGNIRVVVEGITNDGKLCRGLADFNVND